MNRDTELLKIQVYAGYCHSEFRSRASFIFGAIITLPVSLMVLVLQKEMDLLTYYSLLGVAFPILLLFLRSVYRDYHKNLSKVDNMIERVNKGNSLPSVKDMIKGKGIQSKETENEMKIRHDILSFYAGIMVGVLGSLFVSTLIKISETTLAEVPEWIALVVWAVLFIMSSMGFFQFMKYYMREFGTPKRVLGAFDFATIICVLLGIFVIIYAVIL